MLTPLVSILAALVDQTDATRSSLSELRQRLGATPSLPALGPGRLHGLALQYGQDVVGTLMQRLRRSGINPFEESEIARVRTLLPFLARTIAKPEDPVTGLVFGSDTDVDLLDLAAASEGQDLLANPSWVEVLRQLHQDQRAARLHLERIATEQQFTPDPNQDPVEARVFDWMRRLSLRHALPDPAPNLEWISDWVRGAELPPGALEVYGPEGAIAASAAWHHEPKTDLEAWTGWRSRVDTARAKGWRPSTGVLVRRWDNGWTLQALGPTQLKDESTIMAHCVGDTNQGYAKAVTARTSEIWSLRDPDGYPVATMEIKRTSGPGEVTLRGGPATITGVPQVRGPQNRAMHPSHRRYLWDTFRDHLDLLPSTVQQEILGQFLHRGTADFYRIVLGYPERAFNWAVSVDKQSLPDTREAALQDPHIAVRWMETIDRYRPAADTLAAAERDEKALDRYFDVVKKDAASPELAMLIQRVSTATEGAELRERLRGGGVRYHLDERFADDPRYLSRIFGLDPKLSPETWLRLGLPPRFLDPATKADAEAAAEAKEALVKTIVLRDPYAALRASLSGGRKAGDTPERQAAAQEDALTAAIYHNLHHPYREEAYPFWSAVEHAPIGPLPAPSFLTNLKENSGGFNSAYLTGAYAPRIPTSRAEAALSVVLHAREQGTTIFEPEAERRIRPLVDLALTLRPDEVPEAQALLYLLWPSLLKEPAHLARLASEPILRQLGRIVDSDRTHKVSPDLAAWFKPGAPLRKVALRAATRRPEDLPVHRGQEKQLLSFLALYVDQALRPDVVRLFFRNGDVDEVGRLIPLLLDGASALSPEQRRLASLHLPHPHQFPGYAWAGNVPESGKGRSAVVAADVAGMWQTRWITAQLSDRIARLRKKTAARPLPERRQVEEAIEGVANTYRVGQAQSRAIGWGYKAPEGAYGDPSTESAMQNFRGTLARYKVEDLHGLDGGLGTKWGTSGPVHAWEHAEAASGGTLPSTLYYGLLGAAPTASSTLVAPRLQDRTLYNAPAFGDAPYGLRGGIRADSPELAGWIERAQTIEAKRGNRFVEWTGLFPPFSPDRLGQLRVLFLAATPEDAERATGAAVIVPIQTAELPLLGWIPWTTSNGAAGWILLFAPARQSAHVSFKARLGALTRTAPRADPE